MAYLIDGNNLLGHLFSHAMRDRQSRRVLVSKLLAFQRAKKSRLLLVFDGPPDEDLEDIQQRRKKFFVLFPRPGQKADDIIKEVIERQTDFRQFFLVSSDRDLRAYARAQGAKTLTAKEFTSLLKRVLRESRAEAELRKKPQPKMSSLEIGLWLDAFGSKNG